MKLRIANRSPLQVDGLSHLQVQIGNQSTPHDFIVVRNLNRNIILGRDSLRQNGVRMYFDLGALRIGEEYIVLEDIHISSIVRLAQWVVLKPQHMHTCMAQTAHRNGGGKEYVIEQLSSGYASKFSGVSVANAIVSFRCS